MGSVTTMPTIPDTRAISMPAHLRTAREKLGWSLRYAATKLHLSEEQLREWEAGCPIVYKRYKYIMGRYRRALTFLTRRQGR